MPFEVLSNPEFLSEGDAVRNLMNPDRVLIGSPNTSTGRAAASTLATIYLPWVDRAKIQVMSNSSAELTKLATNAMLAQRISSINTISNICEQTGADIADVTTALGHDSRLGPDFLQPGIGFGGSCFKKDTLSLAYLAESLNLFDAGEYWLQVLRMNHLQSKCFVQRVVSRLGGSLAGQKIAVFGWAFKKGTSDTRQTRSAQVIKELVKHSATDIAIFDPGCDPAAIQKEVDVIKDSINEGSVHPPSNIVVHDNPYTACQEADATLILTDWDQFRCLPEPRRPTIIPSKEDEEDDGFDSTSYFSWTEAAPSEIGRSPSKLSIHDNDKMNDSDIYRRNPLSRLKPDLSCPSNCKDCHKKASCWSESCSRIDWKRISAALKSPRWVFDGRNVVDVNEMQRLGFRVEATGKTGTWESLKRCSDQGSGGETILVG